MARARRANVAAVLLPASDPADAVRAADLAAGIAASASPATPASSIGGVPELHWSAGLHPHAASGWNPGVADEIARLLGRGARAVGETGLDFHYDNSPRTKQVEAFEAHAALARAHDLPLIVHSREAERETLAVLDASGLAPERVILHCFSAGPQLFEPALERGYYVSFAGLVTFTRYATPEFPARVAADRILIETDAPYLAPVPHRGRRNEPALLVATLARVAELRGIPLAEAADLTRENARRVYKLA